MRVKYVTYAVHCNTIDCDEEFEGHAGQTWSEVVDAAQRVGWTGGARSSARHRCPRHVALASFIGGGASGDPDWASSAGHNATEVGE